MKFIKSKHKAQHLGQSTFPPSSVTSSLIFPLLPFTTSTNKNSIVWLFCSYQARSIIFSVLILSPSSPSTTFKNFVYYFISFFVVVVVFLFCISLVSFSSNHGFFWLLPEKLTASIRVLLPSLVAVDQVDQDVCLFYGFILLFHVCHVSC